MDHVLYFPCYSPVAMTVLFLVASKNEYQGVSLRKSLQTLATLLNLIQDRKNNGNQIPFRFLLYMHCFEVMEQTHNTEERYAISSGQTGFQLFLGT